MACMTFLAWLTLLARLARLMSPACLGSFWTPIFCWIFFSFATPPQRIYRHSCVINGWKSWRQML